MIKTDAPLQAVHVRREHDRFGEHHDIGIGVISFKVATQDSRDQLLVVELAHHTKGGPGRHFHYSQDQWFYILEGEYLFEVEGQRFRFGPGDSLLVPRKIPHVWAYCGGQRGRILITFNPAGPTDVE